MKNSEDLENQRQIYRCLIDIYQHDGKESWNTFIAFLLAQSIIFAFAGKTLNDLIGDQEYSEVKDYIFFGSATLGLITSVMTS